VEGTGEQNEESLGAGDPRIAARCKRDKKLSSPSVHVHGV
jgi:hypothetical protein